MKKIRSAILIILFLIPFNLYSDEAILIEAQILDQNLKRNTEKCKQHIQELRLKLQPSTSIKRGLTDTARGIFGKDKKEHLKSQGRIKLEEYERGELEREITAIRKDLPKRKRRDMEVFQNLMNKMDSFGNKCEETTKKIAKEVGSALN